MKKPALPSTTLIYLAISGLAALAITVAGIIPSYRALASIKNRIAEKQAEIERQEALFPLFMSLIKEVQEKTPEGFAIPDGHQVAPRELNQLENLFFQLANRYNIDLQEVLPDTQSYLEESRLLKIELVFAGRFEDIRLMLYRICGLPYLEQIERIAMHPHEAGSLRVRLRMALRQR